MDSFSVRVTISLQLFNYHYSSRRIANKTLKGKISGGMSSQAILESTYPKKTIVLKKYSPVKNFRYRPIGTRDHARLRRRDAP